MPDAASFGNLVVERVPKSGTLSVALAAPKHGYALPRGQAPAHFHMRWWTGRRMSPTMTFRTRACESALVT